MAEKGRKRSHSPSDDADRITSRKRVKLSSSEIKDMKRDKIITYWKEQDTYIDSLLLKLENSSVEDVQKLRESESKLQAQVQELTRRENVLNMRLATKQEEMRNLLAQLHDIKQSQTSESSNLHSMLVDPAVNLLFQRMNAELKDTKEKLDQAQNDLSAWKFTPDSVTGKKLMSKCRSLLQENQDLGKQISQGRVAQLEAEVAMLKKRCNELKASNEDLSEHVLQQDEESEALLATIVDHEKKLSNIKEEKNKADTPAVVDKTTPTGNGPKTNGPLSSVISLNNSTSKLVSPRSQE